MHVAHLIGERTSLRADLANAVRARQRRDVQAYACVPAGRQGIGLRMTDHEVDFRRIFLRRETKERGSGLRVMLDCRLSSCRFVCTPPVTEPL